MHQLILAEIHACVEGFKSTHFTAVAVAAAAVAAAAVAAAAAAVAAAAAAAAPELLEEDHREKCKE